MSMSDQPSATAADYPHPTEFEDKVRLDLIKGYKLNESRTPAGELIVATPSQTIGPFYPKTFISDEDCDLSRVEPEGTRAEGEYIFFHGTVYDEVGKPVPGALMEIWQANKWGKYDHPEDKSDKPLDPNFAGFGRTVTDHDGKYSFVSIKPGAYPNPGYDDWYRPPHIHFSIFAAGLMQRIITQAYFPGEELNDIDPILNSIQDLEIRGRLISKESPDITGPNAEPGFQFDIVLRGNQETPFEID